MFPSDYRGHKRCLDALDEILSAYNKMATDSEKHITVDIIDNRINFIASLSTDIISFEDQVKIVTQLINSRTTMKKHLIESSAIDSAIKEKLRTLRQISEEELGMLVEEVAIARGTAKQETLLTRGSFKKNIYLHGSPSVSFETFHQISSAVRNHSSKSELDTVCSLCRRLKIKRLTMMSQIYVEVKELLDAFDRLLSVQKQLNASETAVSNEIIYGRAKLMQNLLVGMTEEATFVDQVEILCQTVKSRNTMKDLGLDTTVMDQIVSAILETLWGATMVEMKVLSVSTLLMTDRLIPNQADVIEEAM
ncbi:hypothetical protein G7Y79_00036g072200 [Physcia stellaris]|nr:hypothetical protein G7Y79_00036g072200 [Physcia stellaris]